MELAELDALFRVGVDGGYEDDEEHIALAFDLRTLIRVIEVIDEYRVQISLRGDFGQKLWSGTGMMTCVFASESAEPLLPESGTVKAASKASESMRS